MTTISRTYTETTAHEALVEPRKRTGGSRGRGPELRGDRFYDRFAFSATAGSHMPLDTEIHWRWDNPLNLIPVSMLLLLLISIVEMLVG
jgi:hypothetical protein